MNNILWRIFLMIMLLLAILLGESKAQFSGGSGTMGDPFLITTFDDLDTLREDASLATAGSYFNLTNDISMTTAVSDWLILIFDGHINGKGFAIRDWTELASTNMNFIQTLGSNSSFSNLSFINLDLRKTTAFGALASGLFGIAVTGCTFDSLIIDSCNFINRSVSAQSSFPWSSIIVAQSTGSGVTMNRIAIKRTTVELFRDISSGSAFNGLMCGQVSGGSLVITNSYIDSVTFYFGETLTSSGITSFFVADATVGAIDSIVIRDCYILDSFTETRSTSAATDRNVGAFIGISDAVDEITIENCYASFNVGVKTTAGFVWNFDVPDTSPNGVFTSYYDSSKIAVAQITGTHTATSANAKTTAQMKVEATYIGFDFVDVWGFDLALNDSYPFLQWTVPPVPPSGYFHLIDLRSDITTSISSESTVGIGWETDANIIEFDSISILYSKDIGYINRVVDSTFIGTDSFSVIARGFNVVQVFDSIYSRPVPVNDTSHITGTGTLSDPFVLYNATDIDSTRLFGTNKYYALGSDIDMSVYSNWSDLLVTRWNRNHLQYPNFGYGLNGRGYTIKNLTMTVPDGGGPTTFISLRKRLPGNHVKNLVFDSCSIIVTGNPHAQIRENYFWWNDKSGALQLDRTEIAFIESKGIVDNITFTNCNITVDMDILRSYTRIGYVYKVNQYAIDTLHRVGLENCNLSVNIDTIKISQDRPYRDFHIGMLSATDDFTQGGVCWIDSNCTMTVDIGPLTDRDIEPPGGAERLFIGSISSGNGGGMYDCYVDGVYDWSVDNSWLGRIGISRLRYGYYGLLSGLLPVVTSFDRGKGFMNRNLFNGKVTTNIDTVYGVSYNSTDSVLFRMGSSYYNIDSANFIPSTYPLYDGEIFLGTAIDTNGITTDSAKIDSTYRYLIYHERSIETPILNQWGFLYGNWRQTSANRNYPHIFGMNDIADTNWTYTVIDTSGIDTLTYSRAGGGGCGFTYEIKIDTVVYVQDITVPINRIDITIRTQLIDTLKIAYAYTDEIDTAFTFLRNEPVPRGFTDYDTTVFSYDITVTGLDATRPILFLAYVRGDFPSIDNEFRTDILFPDVVRFSGQPDNLVCQSMQQGAVGNAVSWRWIKDVTCGWVSGAQNNVTFGQGILTGEYKPLINDPTGGNVLQPLFGRSSEIDTLKLTTRACKPIGSRGYDLQWDKWLCDASIPDTIGYVPYEYSSCNSAMEYRLGSDGNGNTIFQFWSDFDDKIVTIYNLTQSFPLSNGWRVAGGASVAFVYSTTGTSGLVIAKKVTVNSVQLPSSDIYAYGAVDGEGTAQALGNTLRSSFRGIHPKIFRWGDPTGARPDSIFIMTPGGPVKVKL